VRQRCEPTYRDGAANIPAIKNCSAAADGKLGRQLARPDSHQQTLQLPSGGVARKNVLLGERGEQDEQGCSAEGDAAVSSQRSCCWTHYMSKHYCLLEAERDHTAVGESSGVDKGSDQGLPSRQPITAPNGRLDLHHHKGTSSHCAPAGPAESEHQAASPALKPPRQSDADLHSAKR